MKVSEMRKLIFSARSCFKSQLHKTRSYSGGLSSKMICHLRNLATLLTHLSEFIIFHIGPSLICSGIATLDLCHPRVIAELRIVEK